VNSVPVTVIYRSLFSAPAAVSLDALWGGRPKELREQLLEAGSPDRKLAWPAIAVSSGFYDQAHFIHDFQAFSGLNPSAYLAQKGERLNHLPADA